MKIDLIVHFVFKEFYINYKNIYIQLCVDYLLASGVMADDDCKLDKHLRGAFNDFLGFWTFLFFPLVSI